MPSGRVHRLSSKMLGYNNKVNEFIDLPFAWLGNKHRILFHTPEEAMLIGYMIDGTNGAIGGLHHLALDEIKDKDNKKALELMAILSSKPKKPKKAYVNVRIDRENLKRNTRARGEVVNITYSSTPTDAILRVLDEIIRYCFLPGPPKKFYGRTISWFSCEDYIASAA